MMEFNFADKGTHTLVDLNKQTPNSKTAFEAAAQLADTFFGISAEFQLTTGGNGVIMTVDGKQYLSLRNPDERCNKKRLNEGRSINCKDRDFQFRHAMAALENYASGKAETKSRNGYRLAA